MDQRVGAAVRVNLLGGFTLTGANGIAIVPIRRRLRSLIALLALAPPSGWPRDHLTDMLWDRRDTGHSQASLRQALSEARRVLGADAVISDRDMARLDPAQVAVDVNEFLDHARMGEVAEAAAAYRGALLEGVAIAEGGFGDWLLVERARLQDVAVGVLGDLARRQAGEAAIATAQRLVATEPFREESHRLLMQIYAEQGQRSLALRQYQICRDKLRKELDVAPDPETERLFKSLQSPGPANGKAGLQASGLPRTAPEPIFQKRVLWRPIALSLLVLTAGIIAAWQFDPFGVPTSKPMVAVLPFDDLNDTPGTRLLARGLTEDIITDLGRVPEFQVMARDATRSFEGKTVQEAGEALKASFVVQGSIRRDGENIRVTVQLSEVAKNSALWSQRWEANATEMFAIQAKVSEEITNRLGGGSGLIQEAGRIAAHRKPPASLSAYELYLLGTEKLEQMNRADVEEAIRLLRQAVELDPTFARAWIELHHSHTVLANFGADMPSNYKLAEEAAIRALELDPGDPEAHAVRGFSYGNANDLARAETYLDRAVTMAPNQWEMLTFYIGYASTFGKPERGAELVDVAVRLNPAFPVWAARMYAYAYVMADRFEDALAMLKNLDNDNLGTWMWPVKAGLQAATGRMEESRQTAAETLRRYPHITIEGTANEPSYNLAERRRVVELMRLAGFPPCAKPEALTLADKPLRLKECGGDE